MRTPQLATRCLKILAVPLLLARVIAGAFPWRGQARSRVLAVAAGSVVLALGLFAAPVAAVTVSITLKPGAGPPTSTVTVTGTGFGASETVAVDFSATQVATATTSPAGTFSATFTVPKSALPGRYPVTATGQTSGRSATANFLVRADWPSFHFDPVHSGFNPYENVIGPANVTGLKTAWAMAPGVAGSVGSSPAVAGGVVYVGAAAGGNLYAFSATGATGCSGTPKVCKPLWTGTTGAITFSSPAVAAGVVYVAASDGKLYAFSAAGTTGCSGTPKICKPLWTAAIAGGGTVGQSSPAVAGGVVYVGAGTNLYAFSAAADSTHCSGIPKACTPLWTAALVGFQSRRLQRGRHHRLLRHPQDLQAPVDGGHRGERMVLSRGGRRGGLLRLRGRQALRLQRRRWQHPLLRDPEDLHAAVDRWQHPLLRDPEDLHAAVDGGHRQRNQLGARGGRRGGVRHFGGRQALRLQRGRQRHPLLRDPAKQSLHPAVDRGQRRRLLLPRGGQRGGLQRR